MTVNALHPGVVDTDLSRHWFIMRNRFLRFLITPIRLMISKTPIQGAQTTIFCALSSDLEDVTGKYFRLCIVVHVLRLSCAVGSVRFKSDDILNINSEWIDFKFVAILMTL